ncbi:Uncharacterised protein [Staphylococcus lugdunensis]|nr:hypothetical protein HMPREF9308_01034 [Staphylococcus lugdunensis ACS-027-V-Sch2]CCB52812.1 hypothetical protein SLUG_03840 [Staphylococcus lugdunensis N920143]SQE70777.1 Uncharacterised protein [Staphylococcus lugdunensis]SQI89216.1 Uncharacterised protein [Staphylococcus lugdunensis]
MTTIDRWGVPDRGKSSLACQLQNILSFPYYYIDRIQ